MAIIRINFMAQTLNRTVPLIVCLPTDKSYAPWQTEQRDPNKPFKTLYLLHGILGSEVDWLAGSRIQQWSDERNLAVVMPAGENSFYLDHEWTGDYYSQFIGRELVEFTRRTFPLSHERSDTYIGGLSMGGYGALYNGLTYHETFGAIVALSAGLNVQSGMDKITKNPRWFGETAAFLHSAFGPDLDQVVKSTANPKVLIDQLLAEKVTMPDIFMAIGDRDELKSVNDDFDQFLTNKGIEHVYHVDSGNHEWDFWNRYLLKALEWLPLEVKDQGIDSGNIK
ncbi:alpha/beta hydrolase [Lactiplantibacillus mudanjiangensis]|uniref:Acetyl esterase [Lactobacillus paraplantarum] n=1 Tax=Lactiplantibacillus mudanjiangensis TaxID=1296538 RepID=A0A660DYE0_9LACO|nr:alpha/beta hydrolase-fold protein [Lactiplantibacillus mudanjiangensis]VDG22500.1 acetyl esterase [Lactobacillus paraplantarum] [Lactiplantibacillus mudanjiangensis]VDG26959.1 acetyl esterase [Lactobacillus paraplantarum] [Lactiplantibacillus mudanjiangensis]